MKTAKAAVKRLPTACGFDGSPLDSDYWCRRLGEEIAEDDACWNCLDVAECDWAAPVQVAA